MDEGSLKNGDDSSCSSALMSTDNLDWLPVQVERSVKRTCQELPLTEEMLMETTENDDVMELEKSSSNILQMAFLLKTEIERLDYHFSSSSDLQQSFASPEQGSDRVFEELEQVRKSPSSSREPSELHQFGNRNLDRAIRTIKHRSFPTFVGDSGFQMDCMMDTVEPSSTGVERSVSATAFGHEEELELEMKQAAADNCRMFEDDQISDSSLTLAANRSLDMSRSLTDRCCKMAELAVSSDDLCSDRLTRRRIWKAFSSDAPQYNSPKATSKNLKPPTTERSSSPFNDRKTLPRATVDIDHVHNPKSAQRFRVVEEIMETERKYCTCLWILINHFAESLSVAELLTAKDINVIFPSCLRRIYTYHCEFFDKLENRLVNWSEFSTVADLFSHLFEAVDEHSQCDLFVQYQAYVDVFPVALLRIRKLCRRNTELDKFVKDLESQSCCEGLDVGAYLLTPIQRIPRYVLLLKQLVKSTDNAHPDFILVDSCLLKLGEFLSRLNASIKQSMDLVSANTLPRRKRQGFNLTGISFRGNNCTNTEGRQRWSFRRQKSSSPPKANRISLDLSFLGLLKQKMQNGAKDKTALSEQCKRNSLPNQKDRHPSDQLLTSTPLRFNSQPASSGPKSVLPKPFKVPKPKRKLEEEEPGANLTEDAMNEVFSSPNIRSQDKTGKAVHGNGFRDLSLRVQVNRKAFLSKFRRRANQGQSGLTNDLTKPAVCFVDANNCDTNEDIYSKTCDRILSCEHEVPVKETLNETTWIRPPDLTLISNSAPSSESSDCSGDSFTAQLSDSSRLMSISSISVHPMDNESSVQSSFPCVDVSSRNDSIYTSSSIFRGIFPPRKLRRTDSPPKPEVKKTTEVKRRPSMRDAIKNFFVKKGGGKSKICSQSRASNT